MKRLYANPRYTTRMNASCVVVVFATLFGVWELWSAWRAGGSDGTNYLFAALFIGGGIYAGKQLRDTSANTVVALDADPATRSATVTLWRPFSSTTISGSLDDFTDWQFQLRPGRVRTPMLTAHHPSHAQPLEFELKPGGAVAEELRALAPEAVAAFERSATPAAR
jgi:hypothetical protein